MVRAVSRSGNRARIAAAAARIMAENGIDDFAAAKRKAARLLGAPEGPALPSNEEIEAELRTYRQLYQAEHPETLARLRVAALKAMQALQAFRPYLTGAVLTGTAGPHAGVELQLFPDDGKDVEMFLIERGIPFTVHQTRRFAGDRAHAAASLRLEWDGMEFRLTIFDSRDERLALKSSQAGKVAARAGIREVMGLIGKDHAATQA